MDPIQSSFFQANNQQINGMKASKVTPSEAHQNFANQLKSAIDNVNRTQNESTLKTEELVRGEAKDLHDVMITAQKASITVQTATEMQNKAIEAYRQVMRMQI
ncbi:flagellar hook-basal body complex protein FliE [Halalkalibacillus sediminis]|uniref:Flagellar hook-basal body complex protein FliE n=1 Tax=Halalkalibacillus sediminis TaxID=2018042 RepID=A0A2I0QW99_9BACI|nr:flagellar hook-basal body complex protein FliE [Halalkalibacillus sediminis]PKR78616.1 flagellar hook-basal body complex protein FliE [Halalkalibacillus sediminis]